MKYHFTATRMGKKQKSLSCVWLSVTPWNSLGQNTGVGSLSPLQGIFRTQGLNPGLPHCRKILYQLSHKGSPRILEWVTYPFSSRSSQPKNRTGVSYIAGGFFTNSATREWLLFGEKKKKTDKCWWECKEIGTLVHCWWECKWYSYCGITDLYGDSILIFFEKSPYYFPQ